VWAPAQREHFARELTSFEHLSYCQRIWLGEVCENNMIYWDLNKPGSYDINVDHDLFRIGFQ